MFGKGEKKTPNFNESEQKTHFFKETPIHGASSLHKSRPRLERAVYFIAILAAVVLTITGIGFTIGDVANPSQYTSTSTKVNGVRKFPTVTICNMNPVRASQLSLSEQEGGLEEVEDSNREVGKEINLEPRRKRDTEFGDLASSKEKRRSQQVKTSRDFKGKDPDWASLILLFYESHSTTPIQERVSISREKRQVETGRKTPEAGGNMNSPPLTPRDFFYISHYTSRLSKRQRRSFGHQLSHMLLKCSFDGNGCSSDHFSTFLDPILGNCYIFKPERVRTSSQSLFTKARAGLELELNLELPEYLPGVSETAGIKLVVGDPNAPVLPTGPRGITVSPGCDTYFGVTVEEENRNSEDGSCSGSTAMDNPELNLYSKRQEFSYSREACLASCDQTQAIRECSCCLYTMPCPLGRRLCTAHDSACLTTQKAASRYDRNERDSCERRCNPECVYRNYRISSYSGKWPLSFDEADVRNKIVDAYSQSEIVSNQPTERDGVERGGGEDVGDLVPPGQDTPSGIDEQSGDGANVLPPGPDPQLGNGEQSKAVMSDYPSDANGPLLEKSKFEIPSRRRRDIEVTKLDNVVHEKHISSSADKNMSQQRSRREASENLEGEYPDYSDVALSETVMKVRIQLASRDLTVRKPRALVSWHRCLAEIGGHMALWAGVSVIALVHAGHALIHWLWAGYKDGRGVEHTRTKVMAFSYKT